MAAACSKLKVLAWMALLLSLAAGALAVQRLRGNAAQPASQVELDAVRGHAPPYAWPRLEIEEKNDASYAEAIGISYRKADCGTRVHDAVVMVAKHTSADRILIMLSEDDDLRRVEHPSDLPPAYLPANGGPIRDGDPLVLNPGLLDVAIRKRQSHMPWLAARGIWSWIDYSGLLQLPASGGPHGTIDGSSLHVMVCRNGLHYDFGRSLNGQAPEPQLRSLVAMLERSVPEIDDGR